MAGDLRPWFFNR